MSDDFTMQMCRYRDATNSACLQRTIFDYSEDLRIVDWAYFYPHPVFFILLRDEVPDEEPDDISDIATHLEDAGYSVYTCTSETTAFVLNEPLALNPPRSMLYIDSPLQAIVEAASQDLIDRSTSKDFGMHYSWQCGKRTYRFSKAVPYSYRGSSFSSSNVEHVVTYMSGLIFGQVFRPEKKPCSIEELFLESLKEKMKKTFLPDSDPKNFAEKYGKCTGFQFTVSYKECLDRFRKANPVPSGVSRVTLYEAITECMRALGYTCHSNAEGKGNLKKGSFSVKYFVYRISSQQPVLPRPKPVPATIPKPVLEKRKGTCEKKVTLVTSFTSSSSSSSSSTLAEYPVTSPVRED
jgi:hypothetical protein